MGCKNSKASAILELQQIINQISLENDKLEKERDLLKSQHDDRPEEEKDSLQDLRLMHTDLEREIKDLKEIMLDFLPIPEAKDNTFLLVKNSIERIYEIELELEDQSSVLEEMTLKRKGIQHEQDSLENVISQVESQIKELENTIAMQEAMLKDQGQPHEAKATKFERQRTLVIAELRQAEECSSNDSAQDSKILEEENSSNSDKQSYENFLNLSENEINKELAEVEKELGEISKQVQSLELTETEVMQLNNYIQGLQNKLKTTAKNSSLKEEILHSKDTIQELKAEKKQLKQEVNALKQCSGASNEDETNKKIKELNDILNKRKSLQLELSSKSVNDGLVKDIEETLKKVKQISSGFKPKAK